MSLEEFEWNINLDYGKNISSHQYYKLYVSSKVFFGFLSDKNNIFYSNY